MKLYLNHEYNNSSVVVEESVVVITKKKGDMYACIFEKNKKYLPPNIWIMGGAKIKSSKSRCIAH